MAVIHTNKKGSLLLGRQNQIGLNLMEFIIALVLIVILAAIATPSFMSIIRNHRLAATAENLSSVLQFARLEAIKRNANVFVSFNTGDSWCYGINPGALCNCTIANNCSLGTYSAASPQQITLSATGLSSNSIYFEGSHGAASAVSTFTFTLYGQTTAITIKVGRMGGVKICSPNFSGYGACS